MYLSEFLTCSLGSFWKSDGPVLGEVDASAGGETHGRMRRRAGAKDRRSGGTSPSFRVACRAICRRSVGLWELSAARQDAATGGLSVQVRASGSAVLPARRWAAHQSPPEMPQSRAHASPPAPAAAATAVHRSSPPHPLPAAAARWAYSLWTMDRACAQRWDSTVSCQGGSWPAGCRRQHPSTSTRRCPHGLLCLLRPLPCSLEHVCHQHRRAADQGHGGPDD